jgi:hypothetical protein
MDDRPPQPSEAPLARVTYKGDARDAAQALQDALGDPLGHRLAPPQELPAPAAQLGVGTVLVTILATAAFKAAFKVAVDALEEAVERLRHKHTDGLALQVKVETPQGTRKYFPPATPASLAGEYSWKVAFDTIRELISAL